jgi:hypothetical protein
LIETLGEEETKKRVDEEAALTKRQATVARL